MTRNESTLDSSLRWLYVSLRNTEARLLAIEFQYRGTVWKVDTPEEAVALRNQLEKEDKVYVREHEEIEQASKRWAPERFMSVIENIGELQKRLLVAIRRNPGITSTDLMKQIGVESEIALAGVISGLSKKLTQLKLSLNDVLMIEVKWTGKKKTRRFILDDFFLYAGDEHNWPDAWEPKRSKRKQ